MIRSSFYPASRLAAALALTVANPDRLPVEWRTNLYVEATRR